MTYPCPAKISQIPCRGPPGGCGSTVHRNTAAPAAPKTPAGAAVAGGSFVGWGIGVPPSPSCFPGPNPSRLRPFNHRIETLTQTNERAQRGSAPKHRKTGFACRVHWGPEVPVVLSPLYAGWRGWNHVALQMCMKARSGEDVPCSAPGSTRITPSCASSRAMSPNTIFDRCSGEWALGSHPTAPSS